MKCPALAAVLAFCFTARAGITGGTLEISGANCRFPDAAYGNVSRHYLVVWADYSGTVRIFGRLVNGDGSMAGAPFPICDAAFAGLFPSVAFNAASNEFLVTWDDGGDRGGVIFGQRVRGTDGALLGGNFPIGSVYGGIRSAVAWSQASASYLVTFWGPGPGNTAAEVYGQRVNATGALLGTNFSISSDAVFSGYPAISWAPSGDQFLVTWDNFDGRILGRRVSAATGTLTGTVIPVSAGPANDRSCITHDAAGGRWLVAFNENGNAGFSYDQYGQFVNVDGTLSGGAIPLAHTAAFEGDTQFGGDVAFEPGVRRFFSSYGTDTGMGGQELFSSGAAAGGQTVLGTGFYTSLNNAADPDTHRFLTAWEGLLGPSYTILGRLYAVPPAAVQNFAVTQGNGQNQLTWKNPADTQFTGTMIRVKTGGFPTGPTDGTLVVDKTGAPNANDSFTHSSLTNWTTYYYAAFAHDSAPNFATGASSPGTPRPPSVTVSSNDFSDGVQGWTLDVWRSNAASGFGTGAWDSGSGSIASGGTGATNTNDSCTREGSTMVKVIPTTGNASIQVEYDVMAALAPAPTSAPTGNCVDLEGTREDKLVVYYSTTGAAGPWTVAQTLSEGIELPCAWTRRFINLAGVSGVGNNANFALKFQWQFNAAGDQGRVDNVHVLGGAITSLNPGIAATPAALERTAPAGAMAPDTIKITNTGGGTLNFSLSSNATWLSLTPATGSSTGPERAVSVNYNTAQLAPGDHSAVITATGGGGALLTIPVTLHLQPSAQFWEPFSYYDDTLVTAGSANWTGASSQEVRIESGELKIAGGTGSITAQRPAAATGTGGIIAAEISLHGGTGTGDIYWNIYLDDASGNNFARWYGSSRHARGRVGSSITPDMILTGNLDDLYVEIDTNANTSEFFFNGASFGVISHGATPGNAIATVRIERNDRPTAAADVVSFDNLLVGAVSSALPELSMQRTAGEIMLTWPAVRRGAILESSTTIGPGWTVVTPALTNSHYTYADPFTPPPRRFYRLKR